MAVAINGDAIGFAIPCPHRWLQIPNQIIGFDLVFHPFWHFIQQAFACGVTFKRGAHFDDVEINCASGNRLLQAGVIIGLCKVDPVDLSACVGLPWFEETTEQEVMQVLVVEAQEGQFNTFKLAFSHTFTGWPEA